MKFYDKEERFKSKLVNLPLNLNKKIEIHRVRKRWSNNIEDKNKIEQKQTELPYKKDIFKQ